MVFLIFCTNICLWETKDFQPTVAYIRKRKIARLFFASLITHNNKSSFRNRLTNVKCQVLTQRVVSTFHNETKIKYHTYQKAYKSNILLTAQ